MATIAVFVFDSPDDAQRAIDRLYSQMSGGGFSKVGTDVHIESSCQDPQLAAQICRACGGELN